MRNMEIIQKMPVFHSNRNQKRDMYELVWGRNVWYRFVGGTCVERYDMVRCVLRPFSLVSLFSSLVGASVPYPVSLFG